MLERFQTDLSELKVERYSVMKRSSKKGGLNTSGSANENRPNKTEIKRVTKHLTNGRDAVPEAIPGRPEGFQELERHHSAIY